LSPSNLKSLREREKKNHQDQAVLWKKTEKPKGMRGVRKLE